MQRRRPPPALVAAGITDPPRKRHLFTRFIIVTVPTGGGGRAVVMSCRGASVVLLLHVRLRAMIAARRRTEPEAAPCSQKLWPAAAAHHDPCTDKVLLASLSSRMMHHRLNECDASPRAATRRRGGPAECSGRRRLRINLLSDPTWKSPPSLLAVSFSSPLLSRRDESSGERNAALHALVTHVRTRKSESEKNTLLNSNLIQL